MIDEKLEEFKVWAKQYAADASNSPGFFTPFKSGTDFGRTLVAPVFDPVVVGLVAAAIAATAALSALTICASLAFSTGAAGVGLFTGDFTMAHSGVHAAGISAAVAGVSVIASVALAVLTVIALPLALLTLGTRSAATVFSAVANLFSTSEIQDEPTVPNAMPGLACG